MNIKRGFTLIELLLVIGIVSVLASVMFFKVTEAKKKGDDAHMKAQTAQVSRAIYQYKDDNGGRVPGHTTVSGQGVRAILEREAGQTSTNQDYIDALQPLVTSGYLPSIPFSPSGDDYAYIISEDGFEGAFAADLYYEYESEEYNSCDFIEEEEDDFQEPQESIPVYPSDYTNYEFGGCQLIQPNLVSEVCPHTGQISDETSCFAINTDTIVTACGCGYGSYVQEPYHTGIFPESLCSVYWQSTGGGSGTCILTQPIGTEYWLCSHYGVPPIYSEEPPIEQDEEETSSICDGSSYDDWCSCF